MLDLDSVIRQILQENNNVKIYDAEKELNYAQRDIEENGKTLRETIKFYEEKLKFKDEIILRNCGLIIQKQSKQHKLTSKEK